MAASHMMVSDVAIATDGATSDRRVAATVGTSECTPDITTLREAYGLAPIRQPQPEPALFAAPLDDGSLSFVDGPEEAAKIRGRHPEVDSLDVYSRAQWELGYDSAVAAAAPLRSELAATQATREAYRLALVEIASVDCLERLTIARRALGTEHVPPAPAVHDFTGHRHNLTRDIEKLVDVHAVNELEAMRTFGQLLRDKRTVAEALATMLLAEVTP